MKDTIWNDAEVLMTAGKHINLWGPSGLGKTYVAQKRGGFSLTCHDQMVVSDIVGHPWPTGSAWEWKDGPATLAFRHGQPLILNELARCNSEVLDCLLGLLDSQGSASLTLPTGETLKPASGYVAIATSNSDPVESLSEALQDRLISLHVTKPHPALIARIASEAPELAKYVANSYESGQSQLSCRKALDFLELRKLFTPERAAQLCFGARGRDLVAMLPVAAEVA